MFANDIHVMDGEISEFLNEQLQKNPNHKLLNAKLELNYLLIYFLLMFKENQKTTLWHPQFVIVGLYTPFTI